jgi:putative transposase
VVRDGRLPEREIVSGVGAIKVRQPRVRHAMEDSFAAQFCPSVRDALIPALYLKGISTGDLSEAFEATDLLDLILEVRKLSYECAADFANREI